MFVPKHKAGQWSALVETEVRPERHSDNQSDRSILNEHRAAMENSHENTQTAGPSSPRITKTREVIVSYGRSESR
jgi:hypothetical protein